MGCNGSVETQSPSAITIPQPTWTSKFSEGDHVIQKWWYTEKNRVREWVDKKDEYPGVLVITKVNPDSILVRYLTTVIYDDVAYDKCPRDSTKL